MCTMEKDSLKLKEENFKLNLFFNVYFEHIIMPLSFNLPFFYLFIYLEPKHKFAMFDLAIKALSTFLSQ